MRSNSKIRQWNVRSLELAAHILVPFPTVARWPPPILLVVRHPPRHLCNTPHALMSGASAWVHKKNASFLDYLCCFGGFTERHYQILLLFFFFWRFSDLNRCFIYSSEQFKREVRKYLEFIWMVNFTWRILSPAKADLFEMKHFVLILSYTPPPTPGLGSNNLASCRLNIKLKSNQAVPYVL